MTSTIDYIPPPGKFKDMHGQPKSSFNMTDCEKGMLRIELSKKVTIEERLRMAINDKYKVDENTKEVLVTKLMFGHDLKYSPNTEAYIEEILKGEI